jgi:hypothetical protein
LDRAPIGTPSCRRQAIDDRLEAHPDRTPGEQDGGRLEAHPAGCPACRGFATIPAAIGAVRELLPGAARARFQRPVPAPDVKQRE